MNPVVLMAMHESAPLIRDHSEVIIPLFSPYTLCVTLALAFLSFIAARIVHRLRLEKELRGELDYFDPEIVIEGFAVACAVVFGAHTAIGIIVCACPSM